MSEPAAWIVIDVDNGKSLQFQENKFAEVNIPLYTQQYERPHNTVLVPCDKLAEMQEKLTKYELRNEEQRNRIAILEAQVYGGTTK